MKFIYFILSSIIFHISLTAQIQGGMGDFKNMKDPKIGRIYGKVLDNITKKPIEYATVKVLWFNKDSLLGGALVQENGDFAIEGLPSFGQVRVKIQFVGYKDYLGKIYIVPPDKIDQDLGDIMLMQDDKLLQEVEITAEKSTVNLSIDRRTYNVDKDLSVKGGTAVDVMKNVPGVTVDADGNAELRNQSPIIFIDGRPTTLTLQQIPADDIERVEVITNPSVKFDANATGGVLNIVMKRNLKPGYNGMLMAYVGTGDRYGGVANLNVKGGPWNVSMMYSYNQSINNNNGFTKRTQLDSATGNTLAYFNQSNRARMFNLFNFGKLGIDYNINNRNTITLSNMLVGGEFRTNDKQNYNAQDASKATLLDGDRLNDQSARFKNNTIQLIYKKTFPKVGKEFSVDVNHNYTDGRNQYVFTTYPTLLSGTTTPSVFQKNNGATTSNQFVLQADYVNPITETSKLEAGIKSYYKQSISLNNTFNALANDQSYIYDSIRSNRYVIDDIINAAYINYSSKTFWDIGYQGGLRFEQSYYSGKITDKNLAFSYQYPSTSNDILKSIFPAIFLSKKFKKNQEVQINFSRKIQRPNFFQLMPFVLFADKQTIRIGNPELKPEFKNIAELNYNKVFTKGNYLGSVYLKQEEQPITEVAYPSAADATILVNTSINGKNSFKYGMENTLKLSPLKKLDITLNADVYYIYINGTVVQGYPDVKAEGYAYNAKTTISYKLPKNITAQVNGNYQSPRILLLGYSKPVYSMDASLNKMIATKWIFNVTLSDAFNTRMMGTYYETPFYVQDLSRRRETRFVKFTVTYLFGKMDASILKRGKQMRGMGQEEGSQDGLDFKK